MSFPDKGNLIYVMGRIQGLLTYNTLKWHEGLLQFYISLDVVTLLVDLICVTIVSRSIVKFYKVGIIFFLFALVEVGLVDG